MDDAAIRGRMMQTIHAFASAFGRSARGGAVLEPPGVQASVCPAIGFRSIFNAAAHDSAAALERALPDLEEKYADAGVTAWGVWARQDDHNAADTLAAAQLQIDSSPRGMGLMLDAVDTGDEAGCERTDDLAAFDAAMAGAYGFPQGVIVHCFPELLRHFDGYLARNENGEPVCCVASVDRKGDCGLNLVGTVPEARGRGVASRLTRFALREARDRGCTTSTLQATALGEPVYAALGYRDLGAINLWERRTAPDPWPS